LETTPHVLPLHHYMSLHETLLPLSLYIFPPQFNEPQSAGYKYTHTPHHVKQPSYLPTNTYIH